MPKPLTLKPLNNHLLVEVEREYAGISRPDQNEELQKGKVLSVSTTNIHVTAWAASHITADPAEFNQMNEELDYLVGKTVVWSAGAEAGATVTIENTEYALVPYWRLIAFYDEPASK